MKPTTGKPAPPTLAQIQQVSYSGPIPPAQELERYKGVLSNAPERILRMAEKVTDHTQAMEDKVFEELTKDNKAKRRHTFRGQLFGLVLVVFALGCAVWLSLSGDRVTASVIGGTTVIAIAIVFALNRHPPK